MKLNKSRIAFRLSLVAVALLLVCGMAAAQNDQVKGVINVTQEKGFFERAFDDGRAGTGTSGGSERRVQR